MHSTPDWPDALQMPDPQCVQHILEAFWHRLRELPDLLAREEYLLADALTIEARHLVLQMMLALNGIRYPEETRHLNTYLGKSQRQAIEKTLVALSVGTSTWSGRAVALIVIYRWYAPQLAEKFNLTQPHTLEEAVLMHLQTGIPNWPLHIETE